MWAELKKWHGLYIYKKKVKFDIVWFLTWEWFFEDFYMRRQVCHHLNNSLKEISAALKAPCTSVSAAHILQKYCIELTLYCFFIVAISIWIVDVIVDCPPSFEEHTLYFENSLSHLYLLLNHIVNGWIFGWSRHPFIFWA